jgi:diadenosine tetraphosphate (Ap4A) HIT family hydrolase
MQAPWNAPIFRVTGSSSLLVFLANTGSRAGEALALTWENVDLERRAIRTQEIFFAASLAADRWRSAVGPDRRSAGDESRFSCVPAAHRDGRGTRSVYDRTVVSDCPFCPPDRPLLAESPLALAFEDMHPVSPGHSLVVPRRHAATYFECTAEEKAALWALAEEVCVHLQSERQPDGFNVGFNAGAAAGQTVFHAHIHVIPRYSGDVVNPRGGVRHALVGRGDYPGKR